MWCSYVSTLRAGNMFLVVLSMVRQHTWQTHPLAPPSPAPPPTKDFNPSSNYQSQRDFPGSPVVKTLSF